MGVSTNLIKSAFNAIPVYGPPQVVVALLERAFNLVETKYLIRHWMAMNLVLEALDGHETSPFYNKLNRNQLYDSIVYLKRSNTMLSGIISSLLTKKRIDGLASRYVDSIVKQRNKMKRYLIRKKKGRIHFFKNSYYALQIKRNSLDELTELRFYSLIKQKFFRRRPITVVDLLHPKKEIVKRNIMESILVGSSFVPVPVAQSLLRLIYKEVFIREIHRRQMHEAGFKGFLNNHQDEIYKVMREENFTDCQIQYFIDKAYHIIAARKMNPLDLDHFEELNHVQGVEAWISSKDLNYSPVKFAPKYQSENER